jgi:hypothetical protein
MRRHSPEQIMAIHAIMECSFTEQASLQRLRSEHYQLLEERQTLLDELESYKPRAVLDTGGSKGLTFITATGSSLQLTNSLFLI